MHLQGKVALVTGAAGGIGAATAIRLAECGATVVVTDIDEEHGREVAARLPTAGCCHHLDVSDADSWTRVIGTVERTYGRLDVLVLNAGVRLQGAGGPAHAPALPVLTADSYRRVTGVNGDGVVYGVLAAYPLIEASGGGAIIVIGSTAGFAHTPGDPAYAYAKAGLLAFSRSLAPELAMIGIRLSLVCPGAVDTAIFPEDVREELTHIGLQLPSPFFVANAVLVAIERASAGDVWIARGQDGGFFTTVPSDLPAPPVTADPEAGRRFVAASLDGATVENRPVHTAFSQG
ncbi:SDR family NAD(P)-dependent oxidoreductase [Nocardia sp. alder85J]|uniref:SDR family NAD(P)-dependent oxidoreductase n=1 Tax=Nocardia sp. alder85J TaxID=2862949 RepID=UPI001CD34724|nr:SDR family oxidoreductase [Nocardia sp. alder85J]MCX4095676.1 SDR family NAD(P)-dependent oxidoreductase [Nocardia sp. alder85J]